MINITKYTEEQTSTILAAYAAGQTPEAIATLVGRSTRSIIAKLAQLKVYVSPAKEATSSLKQTKAQMVMAISTAVGVDYSLSSLEKASHAELETLFKFLTK